MGAVGQKDHGGERIKVDFVNLSGDQGKLNNFGGKERSRQLGETKIPQNMGATDEFVNSSEGHAAKGSFERGANTKVSLHLEEKAFVNSSENSKFNDRGRKTRVQYFGGSIFNDPQSFGVKNEYESSSSGIKSDKFMGKTVSFSRGFGGAQNEAVIFGGLTNNTPQNMGREEDSANLKANQERVNNFGGRAKVCDFGGETSAPTTFKTKESVAKSSGISWEEEDLEGSSNSSAQIVEGITNFAKNSENKLKIEILNEGDVSNIPPRLACNDNVAFLSESKLKVDKLGEAMKTSSQHFKLGEAITSLQHFKIKESDFANSSDNQQGYNEGGENFSIPSLGGKYQSANSDWNYLPECGGYGEIGAITEGNNQRFKSSFEENLDEENWNGDAIKKFENMIGHQRVKVFSCTINEGRRDGEPRGGIYIDDGATFSVLNRKEMFDESSLKDISGVRIHGIDNNSIIYASKLGTFRFQPKQGNAIISEAYLADIAQSVLSPANVARERDVIYKLIGRQAKGGKKSWEMSASETLSKDTYTLKSDGTLEGRFITGGIIYIEGNQLKIKGGEEVRVTRSEDKPVLVFKLAAELEDDIRHARTGHFNENKVQATLSSGNIIGCKNNKRRGKGCICGACKVAKMKKQKWNKHQHYEDPVKTAGQAYSMDRFISPVESISGAKSAVVSVDISTRFAIATATKTKSAEDFKALVIPKLRKQAEQQQNVKVAVEVLIQLQGLETDDNDPVPTIGRMRVDNEFGKENILQQLLEKAGFKVETTAPGDSDSNPYGERLIYTIKDGIRTLLFAAAMPDVMWEDAMEMIIFRYNSIVHDSERLRGRKDKLRSPFVKATGRITRYEWMQNPFCPAWVWTNPIKNKNVTAWMPRAKEAIYVGNKEDDPSQFYVRFTGGKRIDELIQTREEIDVEESRIKGEQVMKKVLWVDPIFAKRVVAKHVTFDCKFETCPNNSYMNRLCSKEGLKWNLKNGELVVDVNKLFDISAKEYELRKELILINTGTTVLLSSFLLRSVIMNEINYKYSYKEGTNNANMWGGNDKSTTFLVTGRGGILNADGDEQDDLAARLLLGIGRENQVDIQGGFEVDKIGYNTTTVYKSNGGKLKLYADGRLNDGSAARKTTRRTAGIQPKSGEFVYTTFVKVESETKEDEEGSYQTVFGTKRNSRIEAKERSLISGGESAETKDRSICSEAIETCREAERDIRGWLAAIATNKRKVLGEQNFEDEIALAQKQLEMETLDKEGKDELIPDVVLKQDIEESKGLQEKDLNNLKQRIEEEHPFKAATCKEAKEADDLEIETLFKMGVFEIVEVNNVPKWAKTFRTMMVRSTKTNMTLVEEGDLRTFMAKSRLVVMDIKEKMFHRRTDPEGEFSEFKVYTNAPTSSIFEKLFFLWMASKLSLSFWQCDWKAAFCNCIVEDYVYIYISVHPALREKFKGAKVLRLKRYLYGLRESPFRWYALLMGELDDLGFDSIGGAFNTCLRFKWLSGGKLMAVVVHVDDALWFSEDVLEMAKVRATLSSKYPNMKWKFADGKSDVEYTGLQLRKNVSGGWSVGQEKYVEKFLKILGVHPHKKKGGRQLPTGEPVSKRDYARNKEEVRDLQEEFGFEYARAEGCLIHLLQTRNDLRFSINQLARVAALPGRRCFEAIKHLLGYLGANKDVWLCFNGVNSGVSKSTNLDIMVSATPKFNIRKKVQTEFKEFGGTGVEVFVDAELAGHADRKSIYCSIIFLDSSPIYMISKVPSTVDKLTMGSEATAMSEGCDQTKWIIALLQKIDKGLGGNSVFAPTKPVIWGDNKSVIDAITVDDGYDSVHAPSHIKLKLTAVADWWLNGEGDIGKVWSPHNCSDLGTKALPGPDNARHSKAVQNDLHGAFDSVLRKTSKHDMRIGGKERMGEIIEAHQKGDKKSIKRLLSEMEVKSFRFGDPF